MNQSSNKKIKNLSGHKAFFDEFEEEEEQVEELQKQAPPASKL